MSSSNLSLSQCLLIGITAYRDQPGVSNKVIAEAGYALTTTLSIIETVTALAISILSVFALPVSSKPYEYSTNWLKKSSEILGMSIEALIFFPPQINYCEVNSFSSSLMLSLTNYRNQQEITCKHVATARKCVAEVGFALTAAVAVVETATALAFAVLSLVAYPLSSTPFKHSTEWLKSSAFSFGWSVVTLGTNFFTKYAVLQTNEQEARRLNTKFIPSSNLYFLIDFKNKNRNQ